MTENRLSIPTLPIERAIYAANLISAILYGLYVYMVFQSWYLMKGLKLETPKKRRFYTCFGFVQLILVTAELSLNAFTGQLMWIDHRDFPGGPFAYFLSVSGNWFGVCVLTSEVISIGMTDGLLLYRCYIIWNANWRIVALPSLLYFSEVAMGIAVVADTAVSHTAFLEKPSTNFLIPWISLACTLNATLTALIIGRILYVTYGTKSNSHYTGLISMLVESAIPLSLFGIALAVCVARNILPTVPLAMIWCTLVAISPQFIILRVAMGRAWTENIGHQLTRNIEFAHSNLVTVTPPRSDLESQLNGF